MADKTLILRIRTQIGTWKLRDVNKRDTFDEIKARYSLGKLVILILTRVENEHSTSLIGRHFSTDPQGTPTTLLI